MTHRNCIRLLALSILLAATQLYAQDKPKIDPVKDKPITNSIGMKLKLLPAGTFTMGSDARDAYDDEKPVHEVTLTKPFYIGIHEVTQEQYEKVMGTNPSKFKGPQNPVELVSWKDAVEFCRRLDELPAEKASGRTYRVPTNAEWEYACRAGTTTRYSVGDNDSQLGDYAWFAENSGSSTQPVGQKKPNPWGLYDMHGNVHEWSRCWYGDYSSDAVTDPTGPTEGSIRVYRGGGWFSPAGHCRSSSRNWGSPENRLSLLGFRVAADSSSD